MWLTIKDWLERNSRRYPDKLAISNGPVRYTFKQFHERCSKLANSLLAKGMEKGDRVAFLTLTCPWYLEFYYGISMGGMIGLPINYRLAPREIVYILNKIKPKAIIVGKEYIELMKSIIPKLESVKIFISLESTTDGYELYEELLNNASPEDPGVKVDSEDVAVICLTSGTTAMPKGAMLTHRSIGANAVNFNLGISLSFDDKVYFPAPLFHVMGCMAMGMLANGCTMVFEDFHPQIMCDTIQREKPTVVVTAAGVFTMFVNNTEINFSEYDLSSVKTILAGASPMRQSIGEQLFKRFPGLNSLYFSFAQTEASPAITVGRAATREDIKKGRYYRDSGAECFCNVTKIVDDDGHEMPPGKPGEIIVKGPNVMKGYWDMPEETAKTIKNGWLYTGDVGYYDERGRLWVVDRKKDMILSGSENIASAEVETVLYQHPAIADAAVIGLPDEKWGEKVHAVIVLKPGKELTLEGIKEFCHNHLAGYKIPRSADFVDALPRNPSGKILKSQLRAKYKIDNSSAVG